MSSIEFRGLTQRERRQVQLQVHVPDLAAPVYRYPINVFRTMGVNASF